MPTLDFVQFIILILPGFLALFFYKPFVYDGGNEEKESSEIIKAALFGIPGYAVAIACSSNLFLQIAISSVIAILMGCTFGYIRRKFGDIEYMPAAWHSKSKGLPKDTPNSRMIKYLYSRYFNKLAGKGDKERVQLAIVYRIETPDIYHIGILMSHNERYNEILLDQYPRLRRENIENMWKVMSSWTKIINLDSGLVMEVADVEKKALPN